MINQSLLLAGDDAYNLTKSLRFRSSASAYLDRVNVSPTNANKWTWSGWAKRGTLGAQNSLFGSWKTTAGVVQCYFQSNDTLRFYASDSTNSTYVDYQTSAVYRDSSAWYHIVIGFDNTGTTASVNIYVNGTQITSFGTSSNILTQNSSVPFNTSGIASYIGQARSTANTGFGYFDGYQSEVNFIDGQQLTPSSFGETDVLTGVWKPKKYAGTYGTNGFYLPFTDVATTSGSNAGLGKDFSGNGNYWNTNNISVTAGTTYDSMNDVPTMSLLASNYAVLNPLWKLGGAGYAVPSNGNLTVTPVNNIIASTIPLPSTGKWYMEFTLTTSVYPEYGMAKNTSVGGGSQNTVFAAYNNGSNLWLGNGSYGSTDGNQANSSGDVGLIAVDVPNNKLWIGRNRSGTVVWMGGGNPATGTSPSFSASGGGGVYATTFDAQIFNNPFVASGGGSDVWDANFGQQGFAGTPPTGFVALNTFNLPEPSIKQGNKHFDASVWTGNGTSQTITNGGFKPDMIWYKSRSNAYNHALQDSVRGTSLVLLPNLTASDQTDTNDTQSFNSNGFSIGSSSSVNGSGSTYVGWQWQAGQGTTSSNTAGSITSTVSANPTAGFSVVTYTGNNTLSTIGHGLGASPKFIIVKTRSGNDNWVCYHASLGVQYYTLLNTTAASYNNLSDYWSATAPSSSVFGINAYGGVNTNGATYVAYCWAEVAGYSKFGSYTGNGSTDGTFVHLGFRPKFVMIKRADAGDTTNWFMFDTSRAPYNLVLPELYANLSNAEGTDGKLDILSNGFKIRTSGSGANSSSINYIYMAFAENPQKYSIGR